MIDMEAATRYIGIWVGREENIYTLSDELDNEEGFGSVPPTEEEIDIFRNHHLDEYRARW